MYKVLLIALIGSVVGCGQGPEVPELVYEQRLNTVKYVNCMEQLMILDKQCRFQSDEKVFEACMSVHSDYCVEQHTELSEGGVK